MINDFKLCKKNISIKTSILFTNTFYKKYDECLLLKVLLANNICKGDLHWRLKRHSDRGLFCCIHAK